MASETKVQEIIHKLEEGGWAKWVWVAVLAGAVIYMSYAWLFRENGFKGLTHPRAFEQAVIAREMARGNGFTTRIVRPAELWLFKENEHTYPPERVPDTYHAPLWPAVLAPFVSLAKKSWVMSKSDLQYTSDRVIVSVALGFFVLSVVVNFFTVWRLFDLRLALLSMGLSLTCDQFWRFSMSGLPQMLMLFLFSLAAYALVRVTEIYGLERVIEEEREAEERRMLKEEEAEANAPAREEAPAAAVQPMHNASDEVSADGVAGDEEMETIEAPGRFSISLWSGAAGIAFGLLVLAHAMGFWVFLGALLFALIGLPHARWRVALPLVAAVAILYTPWMVRNYQVCGSPVGISWYVGLQGLRGSETQILRSRESPVKGATPTMFRRKVQAGLMTQIGSLPAYFGYTLVAPVFFLTLLHMFRRRSIGHFRWCLLLMWLCALFGMALFGLDDEAYKASDLHVLFIPLFTCYGLAFVLMLWTRLEINVRVLRIGFIVAIFLACSGPFLGTLLELHMPRGLPVQWPPYVPPIIALLGEWTDEKEILMSDMPYAVAWYADRRSLWVPMLVSDFNEMNDYNLLNGRIVGLYLTPVSGDKAFLSNVVNGEYKDWKSFILRSGIPRNFPLGAVTALPLENECTYYSDRDRWTKHED